MLSFLISFANCQVGVVLTANVQAVLEVIMLQVSYSFFNQLGPSTYHLTQASL